jgi:hypothetical protein
VIATLIDWAALWQAVWTAALAGLGVTVVFAIAVLGATRAQDARRNAHHAAVGAFGLLALLGGAATIGFVVYALTVIATK